MSTYDDVIIFIYYVHMYVVCTNNKEQQLYI